jgi:hypothetical protein
MPSIAAGKPCMSRERSEQVEERYLLQSLLSNRSLLGVDLDNGGDLFRHVVLRYTPGRLINCNRGSISDTDQRGRPVVRRHYKPRYVSLDRLYTSARWPIGSLSLSSEHGT